MDIFLCFILKLIYIRKCLCNTIWKPEVDQEASEASGMEFFMVEVRGWKLLTIDMEGLVLDVMWSLDSPLNKSLRF